MAYEEIAEYSVAYIAGGATSSPTMPGPVPRALIGLYRADHSAIGAAYFHRNPAAVPESDSLSASGHIKCNYSPEDFPRVLDLLRNEKPVYLVFMEDPWNVGYIATTAELIGEGEFAP